MQSFVDFLADIRCIIGGIHMLFFIYLCGIPMKKVSTPRSLEISITVFIPGIKTSQPSKPNLFSDDHFFAKNSSNLKNKDIHVLL